MRRSSRTHAALVPGHFGFFRVPAFQALPASAFFGLSSSLGLFTSAEARNKRVVVHIWAQP
eukprot:2659905-Pleurochrysis_carterae.AAC.1